MWPPVGLIRVISRSGEWQIAGHTHQVLFRIMTGVQSAGLDMSGSNYANPDAAGRYDVTVPGHDVFYQRPTEAGEGLQSHERIHGQRRELSGSG